MIREYLNEIFLDHFTLTTLIISLFTSMLLARRFLNLNIPFMLSALIWYLIVIFATSIFSFLLIDFFSHGQGMDRLANLPLLLATLPLVVSFFIVIFIYPK
jgi:hypothetical protein